MLATVIIDGQGSVAAELSYKIYYVSEYDVVDQVADWFNDIKIGIK